jgi:hypothetical protein
LEKRLAMAEAELQEYYRGTPPSRGNVGRNVNKSGARSIGAIHGNESHGQRWAMIRQAILVLLLAMLALAFIPQVVF